MVQWDRQGQRVQLGLQVTLAQQAQPGPPDQLDLPAQSVQQALQGHRVQRDPLDRQAQSVSLEQPVLRVPSVSQEPRALPVQPVQ
jgi:hypothetical protein